MSDLLKLTFRNYITEPNIPLYKYYGNLDYAKDVILNRRIHFELPSYYNDIFDSAITIKENDLKTICNTSDNICNIVKRYQYLPPMYDNLIDKCREEIHSDCFSLDDLLEFICKQYPFEDKHKLADYCLNSICPNRRVQADNNKITCFSENNRSLLMWAYYANNHKGVCLKFNLDHDPNLKKHCYKVNYTDQLTDSQYFDMYFQKSTQWFHEQEWRIVCDTTQEFIPIHSLEGIILGCRMCEEDRKSFIKLAEKNRIKISLAIPSKTKYELEIH